MRGPGQLARALRRLRALRRTASRERDLAQGDLRGAFGELEGWQAFATAHPQLRDPGYMRAIAEQARSAGVDSAFLGHIPPHDVVVASSNYREELFAAGLNPRQRAVMELFAEDPRSEDTYGLRIYAHEAVTPLALAFRARYPRFLGSEYASDVAARERLFPIPAVDITQSGFPDAVFDVVLSLEVLEHVPDLDAALRDTARILRTGGRFLATFPFRYEDVDTEPRAVLEHGQIRHLGEPEYHGNPVDPSGGSLVFQVPGWDIVARARAAGFAEAHIVFWSSHCRALTDSTVAGIFVLEAWR
jgi:Methyltransferase domain